MMSTLSIGGGGDKGAFAVGAIEVLLEKGYEFDTIVGTSTGALIAPLVALGDIDKLVEIYTTVTKKDIVSSNWWRPCYLWTKGLYSSRPLEKLIRRTMGGARFDKLQLVDPNIFLCCVGCQTKQVHYWTQREHPHYQVHAWKSFDEYVAATLASSNQPTIMPPIALRGEQCLDGGVRETAPISMARELGVSRPLIAIVNQPKKLDPHTAPLLNIAEIGLWALDVMTAEIVNDDVELNSDADMIVIRPDTQLPTSGLDFVPEKMRTMRQLGREKAQEILG